MNPLNCEDHRGNTLKQDQVLLAENKDAICLTLEDSVLQFGLEEDGHPVFYKIPNGQPAIIIWEYKAVAGENQYLTVDQDALLLLNSEDDELWRAGGCLSPPINQDAPDHELILVEEGPSLYDPEHYKVLWSIDMDGQVKDYCPEHKLEGGSIAGVVVGSFFAFAIAVTMLVLIYRRSLGRKQTAPAVIERQESAEGGDKKNKKDNVV